MLTAIGVLLTVPAIYGQETEPSVGSGNTYHNQLFYNRFLINPTFSLVRENKSYVNILHRNQYATFEDNSQNYFLTFSNKLNENTALGIGVYSNWSGVIQEFGFNANYATSVRLGQKSKLTFGTNITYFNEGLDKNRIVADENDPALLDAKKESKIAIQPGIALSMGRFDFGLYAENLFKYNQTTNTFITSLSEKNLKASVQYTHPFATTHGLFANARLMPLVQVGKNEDNSLSYLGALLLDLPDYGWFQTTLDDKYGMSLGLGFNLSQRMSIGYLMEKDVFEKETDFGWNHELSLAYTFKNNNSDYGDGAEISTDAKIDRIVRNYEEQILQLKAEKDQALAANTASLYKEVSEKNLTAENTEVAKNSVVSSKRGDHINSTNSRATRKAARKNVKKGIEYADQNSIAYQNSLILDELILRQDSVEKARNKEFEKRFETIVRFLRHDIKLTINDKFKNVNEVPNSVLASNDQTPKTTGPNRLTVHKNLAKPLKKINKPEKLIAATTTRHNSRVKKDEKKEQRFNPVALQKYIKTAQNSNSPKNTDVVQTAKVNDMAKKDEKNAQRFKPVEPQNYAKTTENLKKAERKDYAKLPIKVINRSDIAGVEPGYYLIANVYKNKRYLKAFVNNLTKQGLDAKQFYNRENGLYYVYLADFKMKEDAKIAAVSHLSGKYSDEKWIMQVSNPTATAEVHFED